MRPKFADFVDRFKMLAFCASSQIRGDPSTCEQILKAGRVDGYLMGKTKVFLKYARAHPHTSRICTSRILLILPCFTSPLPV